MNDYMRSRKGEEGSEGFFCRFTFGQFFALLVLEVFTLFFVFYLGARYGPEFLGFGKKGAVVVGEPLRGDPLRGEAPKEAPRVQTTDDPEVAAMANDIVNKAKTPELKERLAQMLNRAPEGKQTTPADVAAYPPPPAPDANTTPQQPMAATGEPPVSDEPMAAAPSPASQPMRQASAPSEVEKGAVRIKSAENAKYSLQVGSYQQMGEANSSVEKWKAKGYPAFLMIADIPDRGRWYRVRVGGFASREEARKYQQQFQSQEAISAIVVMNEQ